MCLITKKLEVLIILFCSSAKFSDDEEFESNLSCNLTIVVAGHVSSCMGLVFCIFQSVFCFEKSGGCWKEYVDRKFTVQNWKYFTEVDVSV